MTSADKEFEDLRAFLGYFFEHCMIDRAIPPEIHPLSVLEDLRRRAPKRARQGLRMAINDCIEMTTSWPPERVAALDAELRANGLLTLTALKRRYSTRLQSILKRGHIRTEVEYYLVRGAAEDPEITADDAAAIQCLITAFEANLPGPQTRSMMEATKREPNIRRRPGNFLSVPLPSGGSGYARVLHKLIAFYAVKSDDLLAVDEVAKYPIAFTASVYSAAVKTGRWKVIGHRPLESELVRDIKLFRRNPSGHGFLIYVSKPMPPNAYEEYEAEPAECVGLEPLMVWPPDLMERRLEDHLAGRPNEELERHLQVLRQSLTIQ